MPDYLVRRSSEGALILVALVALASPLSAQECPDNTLWYGCSSLVGSTTNAVSFKYEGGPWVLGQPCPTGCYNLVDGTFSATGYGDQLYGPSCTSEMLVTDIYQIDGLPPGAPVSFIARLDVEGTLSGPASYFGRLLSEGGTEAQHTAETGDPTSFVVELPLSHAPGVPFQLAVHFSATGQDPDGYARAIGRLTFAGLPSGATISSCQSYNVPVPAQAKSWGALKSIYRD
jgi:hypothetical protein